jgi:hypothetical protein
MFQGVIVYQLSPTSTPSDETSANNTAAEANGDVSMRMELLVAWKIRRIHDPLLLILLLERPNNFTWNEDKLRKLILEVHSNRFKVPSGRDTNKWLIQDGKVLKTEMDVISRRNYKLAVTISEGVQDSHTTNPMVYELKL